MVKDVKIVVAWKGEQRLYCGDGSLPRHNRGVGYMVPYIRQNPPNCSH